MIQKKASSFLQLLAYDPVGNITYSSVNGVENHYYYDPLYQLLSEEGRFTHSYAYDSINNRLSLDGQECILDELNQLLEVSEDVYAYDLIREYDHHGRMVKETLPSGQTSAYAYDMLGRLTEIDLPDGSSINYTYNAADLKSVNRGNSQHAYAYNLA